MKKLIIILLSIVFVSSSFSQESTSGPVSKSGIPFLPAAGDIAIGADALPYLEYLGNLFNNSDDNSLNLGSQSLYLRYHLDETSAIRAILKINSSLTTNRYYVRDDAAFFADPLSNAKVEDKFSNSKNEFILNLGYQKSRGYGKLRGIYGAQINYEFSRTINSYQYGNNITVVNPNPTDSWGMGNERTLEIDNGINHTFGLGVLGGVEYYFLPKICIGGEVGLNFAFTWASQKNTKTEVLIGNEIVTKNTLDAPSGLKNRSLQTIRPANYGGLYLLFHF